MSIIRGTFAELFHRRTGISEINMGQRDYYALQAAMQQGQQQQNIFNQGMLGQLGGFQGIEAANQNPQKCYKEENWNPQEQIYHGKVVHYPDGSSRYGYLKSPEVEKIAHEMEFDYNFDSDTFTHKNGGYVARRHIEDSRYPLRELFSRQKTPNITWLEDRVNEVRVKLC